MDGDRRPSRAQDGGFTLVEIVIAIALVGVLSAVVVVGVARLTSQGAAAACAASQDAARTGAATTWATTGNHPSTFTDMTIASPPALELPDGVTVAPNGVVANGAGWSLALHPGPGDAPPTFVCSTSLPDGYSMGPNGHLYVVVTTRSTWAAARAAATTFVVDGMNGYLATITSAEENTFVRGLSSEIVWFGAADIDLEEDWRWMDGPEAGTPLWSGPSVANGGTAVGGAYVNWSQSNPDNTNGNQDCTRLVLNGRWDDGWCPGSLAYVVEIGT